MFNLERQNPSINRPAWPDGAISSLWSAWLVLAVSLAISISIWHFAQEDERKIEEMEFNAEVRDIELHIRQRMRVYEQVLQGAAGFFASSQNVERGAWHVYVSRLAIEQFYPGILGIGFSVHLLPEEKSRHIQQVRKEGFPDYDVFPGGARNEYTPVAYLEPAAGRNLLAFGYDMSSDPVRRAAMEQARDTGNAAISSKVTLLHEPGESPQAGFLLYFPIYRNGWPVNTVDQRRAALQGYIFSPFSMNELMAGIFGRDYPGLDIEIYDGAKVSPASVLFDSKPVHQNSPRFSSKAALDIAGHHWVLTVDSLPYTASGIAPYPPSIILGFGVTVSLLLFAAFCSMVMSRARAFALAEGLSANYKEIAAHYRKLFDDATDAIALADAETGELTDLNHAMERLAGWDKSELIGKSPKILHTLDIGCGPMFSGFAQYLSGKESLSVETQLITKDGTIRNVEIRASSLKIRERNVLLGFFRDITERKQYEQIQYKSNELLERILANVSTLIAYLDTDFNFIRVNQTYAATDGRSPDYFAGKNHFELYPHRENEQIFREVVSSGQPYIAYAKPFVYEHDHGRGVTYWDWSVQPVKDAQGQVTGLVLSLLDRTDEKRAEEKLRLYGRAIEASDNSIVIVDAEQPDFPIIYVNPAFTGITGYSEEEAVGRNPRFMHGSDRDQPELENIRAAVRENCTGHAVLRNYTKAGRLFWHELYVSPVCSDSGKVTHFIGVGRDITQRRKAEQDLEDSRIQLRGLTARREEVREDERKYIAREIHDELGQVLTGLHLNISLLVHMYAADNPPLREKLQETLVLVDKALCVARNVATSLRPAALDMGIAYALEWLVGRFGSNTGIQCEVHIENMDIQLQENQAIALFRIIQESLTNVARHAKADRVDITLGANGEDYILKICDNGTGFDASAKKSESFGLIGIRERVLILSGMVTINSSPGAGTEIMVRIPINDNAKKS